VMGLAAFGDSQGRQVSDRIKFWEDQDWNLAFKGKSKREWQESENQKHWADIAATVQEHYEDSVFTLMTSLRREFPDCANLIFSGGSALNCSFNGKLAQTKIFEKIYIPPFPGDESISLGCASYL